MAWSLIIFSIWSGILKPNWLSTLFKLLYVKTIYFNIYLLIIKIILKETHLRNQSNSSKKENYRWIYKNILFLISLMGYQNVIT